MTTPVDPENSPVSPIAMPDFGNSMEEGTILAWRVKEGDSIAVGDVLCEVETDKAVMEYESPAAGRLARIVATDGDAVPVRQVIAYLADSDEVVEAHLNEHGHIIKDQEIIPAAVSTSNAPVAPVPAATPTSPTPSETPTQRGTARKKISPAARMLASERGMDPASLIPGSGVGGRVVSTDLSRAGANLSWSPARTIDVNVRGPVPTTCQTTGSGFKDANQIVPQVTMRLTIDADPLLAMRRQQMSTTDCSLSDLVLLGCARAMMQHPSMRRRVDGTVTLEMPGAEIGFTVVVDDGFVFPVIETVERLTLPQLVTETKRLTANAQSGILDKMRQGVITVHNLDGYGIEDFTAGVNPPESASLTIGAVRQDVMVRSGNLEVGHMITLTLSADQRVIGGLEAARFLATLKGLLESPEKMM